MAGALRSNALGEMEERAAADQTAPHELAIEDLLGKREMDPNRHLSNGANLQLTEIAERVGSTAGQAAAWVQRVPDERARALFDKAGEILSQLAQRPRAMQQAARIRLERARVRGKRLVRERPLHVLGGIAGSAFVVGVALRIVRSRHARGY